MVLRHSCPSTAASSTAGTSAGVAPGKPIVGALIIALDKAPGTTASKLSADKCQNPLPFDYAVASRRSS